MGGTSRAARDRPCRAAGDAGDPEAARVLVLYGDVPLITAANPARLLAAPGKLAVLAAEPDDPTGYGRILRDSEGNVAAIIEQKDADAAQRRIGIVNTGVIAAEGAALARWLAQPVGRQCPGRVLPHRHLRDGGRRVQRRPRSCWSTIRWRPRAPTIHGSSHSSSAPSSCAQVRALCAQGVRFADPARVDIRGRVQVGRDVEIDVDVILEGDVELGDGVRIGPFCRLSDVIAGAGSVVRAHCDLEGACSEGAVTIGPFARLRPGRCWPAACTSATSSKPRTPAWASAARPTISLTWAMR